MIISITGNPGSGKSTLAKDLENKLRNASRVRGDHYAKSIKENQSPEEYFGDCRIDWDLMNEHMKSKLGEEVSTPVFNYNTFQRVSEQGGEPFIISEIYLIDQVYPHSSSDLIIYTYVPEFVRKYRRIKRDIQHGRSLNPFGKFSRKNHLRIDKRKDFGYDIKINSMEPRRENVATIVKQIEKISDVTC